MAVINNNNVYIYKTVVLLIESSLVYVYIH